jgi:hypothetical protein
MNQVLLPDDPAGVFQALHMPDFGLSWAGENPFGEGFCLGSEAGNLVLTDTQGRPRSLLGRASASGEAISGVAFSQNHFAVTTRKDINIIGPLRLERGHVPSVVFIPAGAPDVVAAPSGYFVIPLGRGGVAFLKPGQRAQEPVAVSNAPDSRLNFCRVVALPVEKENDLIVCAGRRGGLGFCDFQKGARGHVLHAVSFDELDIVDVCSMGTREHPLAIAAVSRDGSLVFFHDIRIGKNPFILKFNGVKGTVYRVLSARGDIYLLTSNGLFGLFQLADRFLCGKSFREITSWVLRIPIVAADANIVDQKWLLAVGIEDLLKFDVQKMPQSPQENQQLDKEASWGEPSTPENLAVESRWEDTSFVQNTEYLAPAV